MHKIEVSSDTLKRLEAFRNNATELHNTTLRNVLKKVEGAGSKRRSPMITPRPRRNYGFIGKILARDASGEAGQSRRDEGHAPQT